MNEPRRAWLDAGRERFLSAPVLLAFVAWALASTIYIEVIAAGEPLLPWLIASLMSALFGALLLMIAAKVARNRWPDGPGPWRALAIYATAGALRGLLVWASASALGVSSPIGPLPRVGYSVVWSIGVMGCVSIVANRRAAHRRLMLGLERRQRELLSLQSSLGERIEETHGALVRQVQDELGPTLARLRTELDTLSDSANAPIDEVVSGFRAAVANVVRPLSQTLAEPRNDDILAQSTEWPAGSPRAADRISLAHTIAPASSALVVLLLLALLAIGVAPDTYRTADAPVRATVFVITLWLGLTAVRWISGRAKCRMTLTSLVITLAATDIAVAVLVGLVTLAVTPGPTPSSPTFPALAVALAALAPLAVSMAVALQTLARNAELQRAETVADLEGLTAVLRRELWRERRRLALTIHGPIQSALVAAAVTMSRPGFGSHDVPALAATLDQAMAHITRTTGPQPPIDAAARDLAALWSDSAAVTFSTDRAIAEMIDADDALRAVVIEVLREAVSNAIRHGAADEVAAAITRPAQGILRLTVQDDGDGPPLDTTPGLGSATLDEVALRWRLARTGTVTQLDVDLALDQLPPVGPAWGNDPEP